MALLLVPSFATNLWQALSGGNIGMLLRRLWPFLLPATVTVWLLPALIGMVSGSHIRHLLTEAQFRRVFFACVLGLGLAIVNSAIW